MKVAKSQRMMLMQMKSVWRDLWEPFMLLLDRLRLDAG